MRHTAICRDWPRAVRPLYPARCSEVLSPSPDLPGVKCLRIIERVEGFLLQLKRGELVGDEQFATLDEAMRHV